MVQLKIFSSFLCNGRGAYIYIYLRNRHWKQLVELSGSNGVRSGTSVVVLKNTVHLNVLKSSKGFQM